MIEKEVHIELKKVILCISINTSNIMCPSEAQIFGAITSGLILCILFSLKFSLTRENEKKCAGFFLLLFLSVVVREKLRRFEIQNSSYTSVMMIIEHRFVCQLNQNMT